MDMPDLQLYARVLRLERDNATLRKKLEARLSEQAGHSALVERLDKIERELGQRVTKMRTMPERMVSDIEHRLTRLENIALNFGDRLSEIQMHQVSEKTFNKRTGTALDGELRLFAERLNNLEGAYPLGREEMQRLFKMPLGVSRSSEALDRRNVKRKH